MSFDKIVFPENETNVTLPVTVVTKTSVVVVQNETPIVIERKSDREIKVGDTATFVNTEGQISVQYKTKALSETSKPGVGRSASDPSRKSALAGKLDF